MRRRCASVEPTHDREQRSDFFFFPLKVTARRPICEQYRKLPFTRLSFSNIPRNTPLSPTLPAFHESRVITWEESNVRSKSLFPGFGRLIRICSLTVHPDNGPSCHRRERDVHSFRVIISRDFCTLPYV